MDNHVIKFKMIVCLVFILVNHCNSIIAADLISSIDSYVGIISRDLSITDENLPEYETVTDGNGKFCYGFFVRPNTIATTCVCGKSMGGEPGKYIYLTGAGDENTPLAYKYFIDSDTKVTETEILYLKPVRINLQLVLVHEKCSLDKIKSVWFYDISIIQTEYVEKAVLLKVYMQPPLDQQECFMYKKFKQYGGLESLPARIIECSAFPKEKREIAYCMAGENKCNFFVGTPVVCKPDLVIGIMGSSLCCSSDDGVFSIIGLIKDMNFDKVNDTTRSKSKNANKPYFSLIILIVIKCLIKV